MKPRVFPAASILFLLIAAALNACATKISRVDLYGGPAPISMAERTIVIDPGTRYVNVEGGQTVKFVVGNKEFAWNFTFAQTVGSLDLKQVAPPGVLDHTVRAYVAPDPRYAGGGDFDRR